MRNRFANALLLAGCLVTPALASENMEAADACIDALRATGTPDAKGGEVLSSTFSEAGTVVMLRDLGGSEYKCIVWSDGVVGELSLVNAMDDGGGAMAGASGQSGPTTNEERVRFSAGTTGAEIPATLTPGSSVRYLLGANAEQFLYVRVASNVPGMSYQIFNPDGSFLLDMVDSAQEYRGQLWQSGDHVVEVINRGQSNADYHLIIGIE
ncbi:hypothetical protein FGK63_15680 [Ruegeria sediminis]|uniref:Uncharacterized protein n=1 Tax=Ruegeria sediminis TaxID=2583820 RepID=A0ABY2WVC0_9RHOB|nr:hypothetical protein [Ruegeria sediminis]TMV05488.1 hypothetical protein FGK63_15680 [Ruegeria sediminis]